MKLELDRQAAELAAQNAAFNQVARTAARFFGAGRGAVSLRMPDGIVFIGRHGIPVRSLQKKYNLGKHADKPQIFKDLRKTRIKAFRLLSQSQGGIAFFACVPICDFHMNRIGLLSVGDTLPMDYPPEKLATLQDLAKIAFEHLDLFLQTMEHSPDRCFQRTAIGSTLRPAGIGIRQLAHCRSDARPFVFCRPQRPAIQ
jgi:hypothetical protein